MELRNGAFISLMILLLTGCSQGHAQPATEKTFTPTTKIAWKKTLDEGVLSVHHPKNKGFRNYIVETAEISGEVHIAAEVSGSATDADATNLTVTEKTTPQVVTPASTSASEDEDEVKVVVEGKAKEAAEVAPQSKPELKSMPKATSKSETELKSKSEPKPKSKPESTPESKSESKSKPKPAPRTDGFNFHGHHFPLSSFSGGGSVPQNTPYIYRWNDLPSHYLIERISPAGRVINSVNVGDKVAVDNQSYTVTHILRNVENDYYAVDNLFKHPSKITFQTCQAARGKNGKALITFWFAE